MPTYIINGKKVKTEQELTDAQIDEIAAEIGTPAPKTQEQPSTTPVPEQPVQDTGGIGSELLRQVGLTTRAGVTGALSIPTLLSDYLVKGANVLTGANIPLTSQAQQRLMTLAGVPEPQTAYERSIQAGTAALAGLGAGGLVGQAATLPAPIKALLTENLGKQAASAVPASMASQTTAEMAQQEGWGPWSTLGVSVLAGVAGGTAGRGAYAAVTKPASSINNWFASTQTGKAMGAKALDKPLSIQDIRDVATNAYQRVDNAGVTLRPLAAENIVNRAEKNLITNSTFIPEEATHRPIALILNRMRQSINNPDVTSQGLSLSQLDKMRSDLVTLAREHSDSSTRLMARKAISALDDEIATIQPANLRAGNAASLRDAMGDLAEARSAWKRAAKAETVEDALNIAKLNADASAGALSLGEAIKREFLKIAKDKDMMRGFSTEEQGQINRLATGNISENILAQTARLSPMKGGYGAAVTTGTTIASPALGASLAASGIAAGKGLEAIKRSAVAKLQQDILSGKVARPTNTAKMRTLLESYIAAERQAETIE